MPVNSGTAVATNPASAALNDYEVVTIPSGRDGVLQRLKSYINNLFGSLRAPRSAAEPLLAAAGR